VPHTTNKIKANQSDEDIVKLYLRSQNSMLFDELYCRYSGKIYGRCISLLNDETVAQDAVQDIFLKIITNLSKFKEDSRFSTWVYSITYNWCIDLIRKRKKKHHVEVSDDMENLDHVDEVNDQFLVDVEISRLKIIMEEIPQDDKAILLMKYLEELSIKEITEALGKSESAVKMQIKRAKHRFKLIYNKHFKRMEI